MDDHPIRANAMRRRLVQASALAPIGLAGTSRAQATFPNKPVRIIVPQPPGGAADNMTRLIAGRLEARWKQPVILESRPGGGNVVGINATAHSQPDGYTIGLTSSSTSINAAYRTDLPYDTERDLKSVARIGFYTLGLIASKSFPADDVKGMIALVKADPDKYAYASTGTPTQLAGEMFLQRAGLTLTHVPYNGAGRMFSDMVGGRVPLCFSVISSAAAFLQDGRVKVLGTTNLKRSSLYPEIPAVSEQLPGFEALNWSGFIVPGKTPDAIAKRISDDVIAVLNEPDMGKALAVTGVELAPMGMAEFAPFVRTDIQRYAEVIKRVGKL